MKHSIVLRLCVGTVGLAWILAGPAEAQLLKQPDATKRSILGIAGTLARPVGEFQNFVDWGGGVSLFGVVNFRRGGPLGIRFDGSFMSYGHESVQRPLSAFIQRVVVDVNTDNYIVAVGVGPQLTVGRGPVQPYLYGTVGFSYFATVSSVSGTTDLDPTISSTNYDDLTTALSGGAGVMVRISRGKHPVSLDLSAQTVRNGRASYLRVGSLLESPDGSITFIPIESETNLVTFRLGFAFGV